MVDALSTGPPPPKLKSVLVAVALVVPPPPPLKVKSVSEALVAARADAVRRPRVMRGVARCIVAVLGMLRWCNVEKETQN